ncbi:uncharacterized protein 5-like [Mya arenaria]|uniref:uncharacterized protein 5-like n=1 Tax=Mya arenaria TaxID=6604 RepID=UPI0022E3EA75|nr:uncharacterized protein 5-like [Mya arenaria]
MFPKRKYTHILVILSLCASCVIGKDFYCPDIPDWRHKPLKERLDYTQYDLVKEGVFVANANKIYFETKGKHDAHILLQNEPGEYKSKTYEAVLGGNGNTVSELRSNSYGPKIGTLETPGILNETEYRSFWITWDTTLAIGHGTKIDISSIILFAKLDFPIKSMRISYGWGSDGFFRFPDKSDFVTSPQTTTPTSINTSDIRSTQNGITDALIPDKGTSVSRQDEYKLFFIVFAITTGCLGVMLLSTLIGFCCLWNKKKATEMGTRYQPNPVGGVIYEGLRGREQELTYQNEQYYDDLSA